MQFLQSFQMWETSWRFQFVQRPSVIARSCLCRTYCKCTIWWNVFALEISVLFHDQWKEGILHYTLSARWSDVHPVWSDLFMVTALEQIPGVVDRLHCWGCTATPTHSNAAHGRYMDASSSYGLMRNWNGWKIFITFLQLSISDEN